MTTMMYILFSAVGSFLALMVFVVLLSCLSEWFLSGDDYE